MRILYLDLDCCRADHLGINGYHRNTSPNIDAIAREGVSFTNCGCSNSPCLPSRASLFTGRFGINNGIVAHHGIGGRMRLPDSHHRDPAQPFLMHHLWHQGMKTVTFSCFHDRHNAWWFTAGWEEIHCATQKRGQETADEWNAVCLPWFKQHAREDNWFVHVHYWDIHSHYRIPIEWAKRFENEPPPAWPDQEAIDRHQEIYGPRTARDWFYDREGNSCPSFCPTMPDQICTVADFKKMIDGYDGAISYADYHAGQIFEVLDDADVLDETAIIVSGDHGDSFGEHGQYADHGIANNPVHNIPMIVRWPGLGHSGISDALIYGLDLAPTLSELLRIPVPTGWDGTSFAPALRGEEFAGQPYMVWDHGIYTFTRSVRTSRWLLIHILHPGLYPYDEPYWLFDMENDYYQTRNVADERPEVVAELNSMLTEWKHEQVRKGCAPDPLEEMVKEGPFLYMKPETMLKRLEKTGREHFADDLRKRLARFHPNRFSS